MGYRNGQFRLFRSSAAMTEMTIRRPDDWHLHLRDGAMLAGVLPETARHFARAIIMPNLVPPVVTVADARAYRTRIMEALPDGRRLPAPDDALSDRRHRSGRRRSRVLGGRGRRGQALSGRGDDQFAKRRARHREGDAGARAHGGDRHAALRPWRGDARRRRHLRPGSGVHRDSARSAAGGGCPISASCWST